MGEKGEKSLRSRHELVLPEMRPARYPPTTPVFLFSPRGGAEGEGKAMPRSSYAGPEGKGSSPAGDPVAWSVTMYDFGSIYGVGRTGEV